MQSIIDNFKYLILISSALGCPLSYAAEVTVTAEILGKGTLQVSGEMLMKVMKDLKTVGPYVSVAYQSCVIGLEIQKHYYPTIEQRDHAEAVSVKFALVTAENEFERCLLENRNSTKRGLTGRPVACEEIAKMFGMMGGRKELDKITGIYNEYRKSISLKP